MPFVRFLYGWHGEHWLEWGVEGVGCAIVLGAGGFGLRHSPLRCRGGIWPPAFPTLLAGGGFGLRHSPPSSPEGPLQQLEKSSQSALRRPVFFCTPAIPYASKLATVCPGTKKALKRCLRAFFRCCGERGIRTPGTVTRTSV